MEDKEKILKEIEGILDLESLDQIYKKYLGKKGEISLVFRNLKDLSPENRIKVAREANDLKNIVEEKIRLKEKKLKNSGQESQTKKGKIDVTFPGKKLAFGHIHPLIKVLREVTNIFGQMGFEVVDGPEVETEYYNFDALNIPKNHPARDMWDTFWLNQNLLLRTHTSPMQIRYMESHKPPFRIIVPGRCYRYEATDSTHDFQFYQLEGLMLGEKINLAHLRGILKEFLRRYFRKKDAEIRFRPSYFPFVEPGVEVDMRLGPKEKWLEIAGAGMVHPQVLKNVKINPEEWQGFAFGIGLDRIAMLKYKINDIRLLYSGDLRFIKQF